MPHLNIDPVVASAGIITALQVRSVISGSEEWGHVVGSQLGYALFAAAFLSGSSIAFR
jgi:hypothetical protein